MPTARTGGRAHLLPHKSLALFSLVDNFPQASLLQGMLLVEGVFRVLAQLVAVLPRQLQSRGHAVPQLLRARLTLLASVGKPRLEECPLLCVKLLPDALLAFNLYQRLLRLSVRLLPGTRKCSLPLLLFALDHVLPLVFNGRLALFLLLLLCKPLLCEGFLVLLFVKLQLPLPARVLLTHAPGLTLAPLIGPPSSILLLAQVHLSRCVEPQLVYFAE